ncbi:MAG: NAD-binding protein [Acidobacteria bacterium]|nr:NAD-binding protein [Acidobacteriota bacterium]
MKIVIIGYGRVGSRTTRALAAKGHAITLIDKEVVRLGRTVELPNVRQVQGNGIDVDVQREAGMAEADRLLALTREDNVNLMAAQVSREFFKVPQAIARIYEPSHAQVSDDPQLMTVCPTLFAVDAIVNQIDPSAVAEVARTRAELPQRASRLRREAGSDESRFVLIVGGGKVGINLARTLHRSGHEVALIEREWTRARRLETVLECPVIVGDGSTAPILEDAGAGRVRVLVAVTGSDQDNLIACQLAKRCFGAPQTIARVSNPKNEQVLQRLGVDTTISSTALIEQVIERELPTIKIKTLLQLQNGGAQLIEYVLDEHSPVLGRPLKEIGFPPNCNLVAVLRGGATIVPRGETELQVGDMVIALVHAHRENELRSLMVGPA